MKGKKRTKPCIDPNVRCCKCNGRGYYRFQGDWWCDPCFAEHENTTSPEYIARERYMACYGQPVTYEPTLLATGGLRLTDDEKKRMTGI